MKNKATRLKKKRSLLSFLLPSKADAERNASRSGRKAPVASGSANLVVKAPSPEDIMRNIKAGQAALLRGRSVLKKKGITLENTASRILYYCDPSNAKLIIREENGHIEKGLIVRGKFSPLQPSSHSKNLLTN